MLKYDFFHLNYENIYFINILLYNILIIYKDIVLRKVRIASYELRVEKYVILYIEKLFKKKSKNVKN